MPVIIQLPDAIEQQLRRDIGNLDEVATEAALVELYRQRRLTRHQLGVALALERLETDALLQRHNVVEDLLTLDEHDDQVASLRRLSPP